MRCLPSGVFSSPPGLEARRFPAFYAWVIACLFLMACEPGNTSTPKEAPANFETRFSIELGGKAIRVQVALTTLEITKGLMGRASLETDEGMLFVFPESSQRSFWMRNVPINLALGYFTEDGCLDETRLLVAENPEVVLSRSMAVRFVLEMGEGWFEKNGVKSGDRLDLGAVHAAINARGFKADRYFEKSGNR